MSLEQIAQYESQGAADEAYYAYVRTVQDDGDGDDGPGPEGSAAGWTGSVSVPTELPLTESWVANFTATNDQDAARNGSFVLALPRESENGKYQAISEFQRLSFEAGGSQEGSFRVQAGAVTGEPGATQEFVLLVAVESEEGIAELGTDSGSFAERSTDEEDSEWSNWEYVRELPYQWHLYRRVKGEPAEDGSYPSAQEQFTVAGKNDNGDVIWLHPDGTIKNSQALYDTLQAVMKALQRYADRIASGGDAGASNAGGGPSSTAPRPQSEELQEAAKAARQARKKRLMVAGGLVVLLVLGYMAYRRGYFGDLNLSRKAGRAVGKLENTLGVDLPGGGD